MQPIGAHGGEVMYFWSVCFKGELGFMNCDYIYMCVVNKQFELIEFVLNPFICLLLDRCVYVMYVVVWSCLVLL